MSTFRTVGPFDLNWETQQYKSWLSQYITFTLLACLQAVNLFWLFFIIRIAVNVVFSDVVKDVRSDDEDEDEPVGNKSVVEATNGSALDTVTEIVAGKRTDRAHKDGDADHCKSG